MQVLGSVSYYDTSAQILYSLYCSCQYAVIDSLWLCIGSFEENYMYIGASYYMWCLCNYSKAASECKFFLYGSPGSSKKGNNNIIRSIKLVKVNGAVLSIHAAQNLKQIAVGSDQGYVRFTFFFLFLFLFFFNTMVSYREFTLNIIAVLVSSHIKGQNLKSIVNILDFVDWNQL